MEWQRITSAPFDRDLELAVTDYDGVHALAFPCRRVLGSWIKAETKHKIDVYPTDWREYLPFRFVLFGNQLHLIV
jgi:hypothetical protein